MSFKRLGIIVLAALAPIGALAQAAAQVSIFDPAQLTAPGYVQSYYASLVRAGETGVDFTALLQYGGFGQRRQTPMDWSQYDSFGVTVENLEGRTVQLGIKVEQTTNVNDATKAEHAVLKLRPWQRVQVVFDLRSTQAAALGMHGLPPLLNTEHRRFFGVRSLNLAAMYGWWLYVRDAGVTRLRISDIKLYKRPDSYPGAFDGFGQTWGPSWTERIWSTLDLQRQAGAESADLARYPGPGQYDGTTRFPPVGGTGRWRVQKMPSGKWYFVNPSGRPFWSMGVLNVAANSPTIVSGRESLFASLPPNSGDTAAFWGSDTQGRQTFDFTKYNLQRKYGPAWQTTFARNAVNRLKSWGFNTVGAWSDPAVYAIGELPYTINLTTNEFATRLATPFSGSKRLPDPFASDFRAWCAMSFSANLAGHNGRAMFMGVYVDDEPRWGTMDTPGTRFQIATAALNAQASQPAKVELLRQLRSRYSTIGALNSAWGTAYSSWASLDAPNNFTKTTFTAQCQEDFRLFVISYAQAYYANVKAALADAGSTALYLGPSEYWVTPETTYAAMANVDVYSLNVYADPASVNWNFPESSKPVMISGFSFGATDRGALHTGPVGLADQAERAEMLQSYVGKALRAPKVVGVTWFTYYDQPSSGRAQDGENYNSGLISVGDNPFAEMIRAARGLGYSLYVTRGR